MEECRGHGLVGTGRRKIEEPCLPCSVSIAVAVLCVPQDSCKGQLSKHERTFRGLAANRENEKQLSANSCAFQGILGIKDKVC